MSDIPLSSADEVRYPIDGTDVVFYIRPSTKKERAKFRRDLRSEGAVYHDDEAMLAMLKEGIRAVVAEDQRAELIEMVNAFQHAKSQAEPVDEALARDVAQIEVTLRRHYSPYAGLESDRQLWLELASLEAFERFVVRWEGIDVKPVRMDGRLTEETTEQIDDEYIALAGWKAIDMMRPNGEHRKNSKSPSQSAETPAPTTADGDLQTTAQAG